MLISVSGVIRSRLSVDMRGNPRSRKSLRKFYKAPIAVSTVCNRHIVAFISGSTFSMKSMSPMPGVHYLEGFSMIGPGMYLRDNGEKDQGSDTTSPK